MTAKERFERGYIPEPNTGCWLWMKSARGLGGHAAFRVNGKLIGAARFAYAVFVGQFDPNLHVLHHCDTPLCVNPKHLFLGTQRDNNQDRDRKQRQARGATHGKATISEKEAIEIKRRFRPGTRRHLGNRQQLALEFKVSPNIISHIGLCYAWKHLK